MKDTIFRYRVALFFLIYFIAFSFSSSSMFIDLQKFLNITLIQYIAILLSLVGVSGWLLRVWASSYVGPSTVHSTELGGERLVTSGPYSYVRNPLYDGSVMMSLGFVPLLSVECSIFLIVANVALIYFLVRAEESYLKERYGEVYERYRLNVPAFLPSLKRYRGESSALNVYKGIKSEVPYLFVFSPLIGAIFLSNDVFYVSFYSLLAVGLISWLTLRRAK